MSGEGKTRYAKMDNSMLLSSSAEIDTAGLWTAPVDLDSFLTKVYEYYRGKGFTCSLLSKIFNFLSFTWVAVFILFICAFFDIYDLSLSLEAKLPENPVFYLLVCIFVIAWLSILIRYLLDLKTLFEMRWFYTKKLGIAEAEIPSIMWSNVVDQLVLLPGLCRTGDLTHLQVAQRILRKENYLIAMINKDILALHFPFMCGSRSNIITKSMEWSLSSSLFQVLFENSTLKYSYEEVLHNIQLRNKLTHEMKKRFILVGILSLVLSPFIFLLLLTYFVLKYGEELRNKPNSLGFQVWSRYAHWKFREFNELPHDLEDRLNMAVSPAKSYVDQFTSNKIILFSRFVLFVCGSIVVSILVASFFNPDLLEDDLFLERNGLWWLAVCGSILALCRAFIPEDNFVFQPEHYFDQVSTHTHYLPSHWQENCRSAEVLNEFYSLFQYRLYSLLLECMSVLFVPFIFLISLPQCAEEVVLFIHENTRKAEDVGDICSFSDFDFEKHGNSLYGSTISAPEFKQSCDGKMEQSFVNFSARNPNWRPNELGKEFISNLNSFVEDNIDALPHELNQSFSPIGSAHSLGSSFSRKPNTMQAEMMHSILQLPLNQIAQVQHGFREKKSLQDPTFFFNDSPL